jgi:hypothetical protein
MRAFSEAGRALSYEATMTIIGDPGIEVLSPVRVLVFTPNNVLHYTSGIYLVKEVTDSIDSGGFTSTLTLFRPVAKFGTSPVQVRRVVK